MSGHTNFGCIRDIVPKRNSHRGHGRPSSRALQKSSPPGIRARLRFVKEKPKGKKRSGFPLNSLIQSRNTFHSIGASKSCRSSPYSLKCLVLNVYLPGIFDFEALIDGFLSIFHPEILSVIFIAQGAKYFYEILFKTMEGIEDQSCSSSSKIKCRQHSFKVKQIIVKKFKGIKETIRLSWDAFSKAACEETYKVDF